MTPVAPVHPVHRPPTAVRLLAGALAVAALALTGVLLLSDRAPGTLRRLFGDRARGWTERIDARSGLELDPGRTIPDVDVVVHIALWAVVTLLVGLTLWTWRGLLLGMAAALVGSVVIEFAQGRWTQTRAVELEDVAGNTVGIVLGGLAASLCYGVWSSAAAIRRGPRGT